MKIRVTRPFWLDYHIDALVSCCRGFRRYFFALFAFYVFTILVVTVTYLIFPYHHLTTVSNLDVLDKAEILDFARVANGFAIAAWLVSILSVGLLLVWIPLAFPVWLLSNLALEFIWQWFYPTEPRFFAGYRRITAFLQRAFSRGNDVLLWVATLLAAITLLIFRIWEATPEKSALVCGVIFLSIVPYVYTIHWTWFIRMHRNHSNAKHLTAYLFSQQSARHTLKSIIDLLVFLVILTWLWLPTYFVLCRGISDRVSSAVRETIEIQGDWDELSQKLVSASPDNKRWMLPSPSEFEEHLDLMGNALRESPISNRSFSLQKYFFALVMFCALFALGIPAVYNAVSQKGYRVAFQRILVATAKTTILLGILQWFVLKTYFVDMSDSMGMGAAFSFIIAVAISHDETFYRKLEKRPKKRYHEH